MTTTTGKRVAQRKNALRNTWPAFRSAPWNRSLARQLGRHDNPLTQQDVRTDASGCSRLRALATHLSAWTKSRRSGPRFESPSRSRSPPRTTVTLGAQLAARHPCRRTSRHRLHRAVRYRAIRRPLHRTGQQRAFRLPRSAVESTAGHRGVGNRMETFRASKSSRVSSHFKRQTAAI